MTPRLVAAALLAAALLLYVGLARPAAQDAAAARALSTRLRLEKRQIEAGLATHERAITLGRQAIHMDLPENAPPEAVGRLRRSLLEAIREQAVSGVQLAVSGARAPLLAEGKLRAEGPFAAVVGLSGRVVRPGAGFVLSHVRFAPTRRGALRLEVDGLSVDEAVVP